MPRFGRGFPAKFKVFGVISGEASLAVEDTLTNTAVSTQTMTTAEAQAVSQSGSSTLALVVEATSETESVSATSSQTIYVDATSETDSSSGTGDPTAAESIAEVATNVGGLPGGGAYGEGEYGEGEYGSGSGSDNQTILEAIAESPQNSATGTPTLTESEAEAISNTGTGTQSIADTVPEPDMTNVGDGSQYISEATAETILTSATATIITSDFETDEESSTGTGDPTITEAVAESFDNSAESTQEISEAQPGDDMTNSGNGSQTLSEAIAESLQNSEESTQTIAEALAEDETNSGTSTPEITVYDADGIYNEGQFIPSALESLAEYEDIAALSQQFIDEDTHIRIVPISDISTGTWTVDPLYEKVDEFYPIGGYPTESIRSGNNPVNDKAVLGLAPASDPGIDTEHYINIQFYKQGDETLDFTVNLKEGSTLIATRTFTDVTETIANPRLERIALTTDEADDITDYSNLNIELIANQTS